MPASSQLRGHLPVQTSSCFRKPSSKTTLTLSFVIACGLSRTDGTWRLPSSDSPLTSPAGGSSPLASAMASFDGRVGLLLDRLVDGHALVAGEDVLDALGRRVLAGDRDLRRACAALSAEMAALPRPSLAASTPSILLLAFCSICSKIVSAFWLSQSGTDWSATFTNLPALYFGLRTES